MISLDDIKADAQRAAYSLTDIKWEQLDTPEGDSRMRQSLQYAVSVLPDLESIYTKLTNGKSVLLPDADSPLPYEEQEEYAMLIAEQLHQTYILAEVKSIYEKVTQIIELSRSN
jgi:hypothetical protein